MATYDPISPPTLAGLLVVKDNPGDSESPDTLGAYDRQIKHFIYDYLSEIITDDPTQPTIKAAAIPAASLTGLVSGSTSNAGTQQGIVQGTVSTVDLRTGAVNTTQLADGAVTTAKLADVSVTAAKIVSATITNTQIADTTIAGAKLVSKAVDTAQINDSAVTATQLAANAVITTKILDANVTPPKLGNGSSAGQILVTGTTPYQFAVQSISGDATLDSTGKLTMLSMGIVELEESAGTTTNGGAAAATTWNLRGVSVAWTKKFDTVVTRGGSTYVSLTMGQAYIVLLPGTYIIAASAPAYKTDKHQTRIARYHGTLGSGTFVEAVFGTSETAPAAASMQSRSRVEGMLTFASGDYFQVEHYTTSAEATDGLGLSCGSPATNGETPLEIYAQVRIQQVA